MLHRLLHRIDLSDLRSVRTFSAILVMGAACCGCSAGIGLRSSAKVDCLVSQVGGIDVEALGPLLDEVLRRASALISDHMPQLPFDDPQVAFPNTAPTPACVEQYRARYAALASTLKTGDVLLYEYKLEDEAAEGLARMDLVSKALNVGQQTLMTAGDSGILFTHASIVLRGRDGSLWTVDPLDAKFSVEYSSRAELCPDALCISALDGVAARDETTTPAPQEGRELLPRRKALHVVPLSSRLEVYQGSTYLLPLSRPLEESERLRFNAFVLQAWLRDPSFDSRQMFGAGIDAFDFLGSHLGTKNAEDWNTFFCSEFCTASLKYATAASEGAQDSPALLRRQALELTNTSEVTPLDLDKASVMRGVFAGPCMPLMSFVPRWRQESALAETAHLEQGGVQS